MQQTATERRPGPMNREQRRQAARMRREIELRTPLDRTTLGDPAYPYHDERDEATGRVYAVADDYSTKTEVLADTYGDGRHYRPWASKKAASRALGAVYFRLAEDAERDGHTQAATDWRKRGMATSSCASILHFNVRYTDDGDEMRLGSARFCHDPLCPMCLWRRSIRNTAELTATIDRVMDGEPVRFLLLTLTVPNCAPEDMRETIGAMHVAFGRMTQAPWWQQRIRGYVAKTEWTWSKNPAMKETPVNVHMHVLLVVPASYFDRPEAWRISLRRLLREIGYNPRKSAGSCRAYDRAVVSVRDAVARAVLADAAADGVTLDDGPMWRTRYRQRFQRLMRHIDDIAAAYRPGVDADSTAEREAAREFAAAVADAADVTWMDQTDWLIRWRDAMRDQSIMDVHITAVKHHNGEPVREYDSVRMKKAVKEVCKYTQKSVDYILPNDPRESERRVGVLREQLTGLRMLSYGGIMKTTHTAVLKEWAEARGNKSENLDDELIHTSGRDDGIDADERIIARWAQDLRAYTVRRSYISDAAWQRAEKALRYVPPLWNALPESVRTDIWKQIAIYASKRELELRKQDAQPRHHFAWHTDDLGYPVAVSDDGEMIGGASWAVRIGLVEMIQTENVA